jgi:hypothetical protein
MDNQLISKSLSKFTKISKLNLVSTGFICVASLITAISVYNQNLKIEYTEDKNTKVK